MRRDRFGAGWVIPLSLIEQAVAKLGIAKPVLVTVTGTMSGEVMGLFAGEQTAFGESTSIVSSAHAALL